MNIALFLKHKIICTPLNSENDAHFKLDSSLLLKVTTKKANC